MSFDHQPAPKTTLDVMCGAVGVDFNVDHLAVTETDAFGIELILINPAWTSTIGAVKYASRRSWSVHAAAAGVIARRGQKLTERLPRAGTAIRVPV